MSQILPNLLYTKDHEWAQKTESPKTIRVGITDFAQASLGDVTYVQLPKVGEKLLKGATFGSVESVKAVSDLYSPVSGIVSKVNESLNNDPSPINTDPFGKAWMIEIELQNEAELKELLSADAYAQVAQ